MKKQKIKWVLSHSGIRHIKKGKVYACNQAMLHTGNYKIKKRNNPTCAKCLILAHKKGIRVK